jgi:AGCS family alanine or glycine:cation symporter
MLNNIFNFLSYLDHIFWGYIGFFLIAIYGFYFLIKCNFFPIFGIFKIVKNFFQMMSVKKTNVGIHPMKIFFSSVGGMIGIGNIVGVITAVQIGGPGAVFWLWMASFVGAIIKYQEIYLGLKFREKQGDGYCGGPMHFAKKAFKNKIIPIIICLLLCIYGTEIYQFNIVVNTVSSNFLISKPLVMIIFLLIVLFSALGGIKRIAKICSIVMPFFIISYFLMGSFLILKNINLMPSLITLIFKGAFSNQAIAAGAIGSSFLIALKQGLSKAIYSADIGIGYDSIIQSESFEADPKKQAYLAMFGVYLDNIICTISCFIVLISNLYKNDIESFNLVKESLSKYFPFMNIFIPTLFFITGFTTIISYLIVGVKCARFINKKRGKLFYFIYSVSSFILFSFLNQNRALLIMSLSGGALVVINLTSMFILRKEVILPNEYINVKEII